MKKYLFAALLFFVLSLGLNACNNEQVNNGD